MALNIKDEQTDRLARELARETGESITVAARRAIQERLVRIRAQASMPAVAGELRGIITRGRARAMVDERSADDVLGYDEHGLPG